jgi:KDO2-lipid IV(A) lauroyltransferase
MLARHLRRVLGPDATPAEVDRAVRRGFRTYGRYYAESFRLPELTPAQIDDGVIVQGYGHIREALRTGTGPIMAIPHLGGWEWASFWLTRLEDVPCSAVVEALEPPELFEFFADLRRSFGVNPLPLGPGAGPGVLAALRRNELVCLLSDRDLEGSGPEVEFFGETTTLPAGPALLALRSGATLLPSAIYFEGRRHRCVVRPPVPVERRGRLREDVRRITQDLARELEVLISAAPDQWHMMQPNWPSDPR